MNNNDSYIFMQGIQHFLTIQFFFEEELLNLNKAGKYSKELLPLLEWCQLSVENHLARKLIDKHQDTKPRLEKTEGKNSPSEGGGQEW